MLNRFLKILEWIGHGSNLWTLLGLFGWQAGLTAVFLGMLGWAVTFFVAAADEWSVTGVWLASLGAGAMVAVASASVSVFLAARHLPQLQTVQDGTNERIPVVELRKWASDAGWCADAQAIALNDNHWWEFGIRLRQAAAEGEIGFWGKRYDYEFSQKTNTMPFTRIPKEHFEEFGLDAVSLAHADNYDIFTGKLGESPSTLRGKVYRDLQVNAGQARAWLKGKGAPPHVAGLSVKMDTKGTLIGDHQTVCAIEILNNGMCKLDDCLVQVEQFSRAKPDSMPLPLVLRTEGQIRGQRTGRFTLSREQPKSVPILFCVPHRRNEWYFLDENGLQHRVAAGQTMLLVGLYGGTESGKALVHIDIAEGWRVHPTVSTVDSSYVLGQEENSASRYPPPGETYLPPTNFPVRTQLSSVPRPPYKYRLIKVK
jgi:hypothetical protein